MRAMATAGFLVILLGFNAQTQAGQGNWSFGVRIGGPAYGPGYYRHHWHHPPYYAYRPYPIYVQPAPIYVPQPPVIVQPAPIVQQVQPVYQTPVLQQPPSIVPTATTTNAAPAAGEIDQNLQQLADPDERIRSDSAIKLGRMKAQRAIDPLAATLAGDRSPVVREAAARALALIGSTKGLPALRQAALADSDSTVRHTAQFAVEVVQSSR